MTTATLTGTDIRLRDAVVRQLDWDPEVDDSEIGVAAKEGVVMLTGFIDTYAGKLAAERVAKRVRGVRAVANDLVVRLKVDRTDAEIAADAVRTLKLRTSIPDNVQAMVHNRHITLTGKVHWLLQKEAAAEAVRHVAGIQGVRNHIDVEPHTTQRDVRRRIVEALHRDADLDARRIDVTLTGDTAALKGTVRSWTQRDAAERAAGSAPGIRRVHNEIVVVPPDELDERDEFCWDADPGARP
jgi:osmotically-inducible protein OsmY